MPAYTVTCPECRASLKSSRPIAPGTPLECPKCQVMFAAPAAKPKPRPKVEVIDDVEVVDDVEVIDDVEVVDDAPARPRSKAAARPAPKRAVNAGIEVVDDEFAYEKPQKKHFKAKKGGKGGNGLVIALVAVGLVVVLGGGAGLAWWLLSGGGADDPMAYMPADSQFVVGVDGAALFNSSFGPKIEPLLNNPAFPFAKYKQDTNTAYKDMFQRIVAGGQPGKVTFAIKAGVPWNDAKLASVLEVPTKSSVGGVTVYRRASGSGTDALAFPAKTVALFVDMPDAQLSTAVKARGSPFSGDLATMVGKASKATIFVATVPDGAMRQQMQGMAAGFGGGSKSIAAAAQSAKAAGVWVTLGASDIEMKVAFLMTDAAAAQKATAEIQAETQQQAAAAKAMMAVLPLPASVKALMQELSDGQQVTTDGTMAVITSKVTTATLDGAIGDLSNMASMFGGGGGPQAPGGPAGGMPGRGPRRGPGGR